MRRFLPGATSFKSWSSGRFKSVLFALSKTSRHELIATFTDNSCEVTVIRLSFNPAKSLPQKSREETVWAQNISGVAQGDDKHLFDNCPGNPDAIATMS